MGLLQTRVVDVVTEADGSFTGYTDLVKGRLIKVQYVKTDFADGVDFTITGEDTGQNIWVEINVNAAVTKYLQAQVYDGDSGAAIVGASAPIWLNNERIKVVIASGGNAKIGQFVFSVES